MLTRLAAVLASVLLLISSSGCGCPERVARHFDSITCATDGGAGVLLVIPSSDLGNVVFGSATTCGVSLDAGVVSLTLQATACPTSTTAPTHNLLTAQCNVGPLAPGTWEIDGAHVTVKPDGGVDLNDCHR